MVELSMLLSAKLQQDLCVLLSSDLCPSGSLNRLGGPKQVILAASGDGWVEQYPLGVCPSFANYPGSNCLLFICDFNSISIFCYEVCSVSTKV